MNSAKRIDRREFLIAAGLAAPALALGRDFLAAEGVADDNLRIQRLTWAGLKLQNRSATLLIDPLTTDIWGGARGDDVIVPIDVQTRSRYVLVTHAHNDHYDRDAIRAALEPRGRVICHASIASYVASDGFRVIPIETFEPVSRGGFTIVAVPATDGVGDHQVSWVVSSSGKRIIHCGDTLWHGSWWTIGDQYGPFDAAFLPINGATMVQMDPPSRQPMSLTPRQAVAAGVVLRARLLVPIHYGFSDPEEYVEYPEAEAEFLKAAKERGVAVQVLDRGVWLEWPS